MRNSQHLESKHIREGGHKGGHHPVAPAVARYESHVAPAYLTDYRRIARFPEGRVNVYLVGVSQARNIVEA